MRSRLRPRKDITFVVLVLTVCIPAAFADTAATARGTGTFAGFVTDAEDAHLRGVLITITDVASGREVTVVTGDHGGFRATGLAPGRYAIRAELSGFQTGRAGEIALGEGETRELEFTLRAAFEETVTVLGATPATGMQATEIRDSNARDIGEALSRLDGLSKIRKGGIASDVILHGHRSKDLAVLIDGQRVHGACPNYMDPAVFHADFAEVDHVDVGKGPFDVVNEGSLGGVINIVTKRPAAGVHVDANLSAGSFSYVNPTATLSYGGRTFSLLAGYSHRSSDAYHDGTGTPFTEVANYRQPLESDRAFGADTGWLRLGVEPRPREAVRMSWTRQRAYDVLYPYLQMDALYDEADRVEAAYEREFAGGVVRTIAASAHYTRVSHSMDDALRVTSSGAPRAYSMMTDARSEISGARVQLGLARLVAGAEFSRRTWDAATLLKAAQYRPQHSIPGVTTENAGVYGKYSFPLGSASTRLDAGARIDWARSEADPDKANTGLYYGYHGTRSTSASDAMPAANLQVSHRFSDAVTVSGGAGHAERVPDPQERYFALSRMGTDWVGNPTLPTVGNTALRADVTYQRGRVGGSATVYHEWLSNLVTLAPKDRINSVPGSMNAKAQTYMNVDGRMRGGEASVTCALADTLYATVRAAYVRGTKSTDPSQGVTSENIAEIPPLNGSVSLRHDRGKTFAEAELMMAASQHNVDADVLEQPTPGYGVLNLRAGRELASVRVTVAVDNVFDRTYLDFTSYQRDPFRSTVRVFEPGRNVYVNVSYRF